MNQAAKSPQTATQAIIYCRVSSNKQVKKGDGLNSQETRCREFAAHKGYEVVQVFRDEGVSGGMIDRPRMLELLIFLKERKAHSTYIVIIDDISRLARGLEAHIQLRTAISEAGGILQSPSIEFGEDSDSRLVENLLAAVSQHQRQKNAEQVVNRMRARLMNGYWVFQAPVGYRYERAKGGGKVLVRDEPNASLIKECLERFADGRFTSQTEIKRYLEGFPTFPHYNNGKVHLQKIRQMLERSLYAGYVDAPRWDVVLQPGKHEALISFETYQRIQKRLHSQSKAPAKKSISEDFPLRGTVCCGLCQKAMTGAWAKGRYAKYAYYYCFNRDCSEYRKSIRKDQLEKDFDHLIARLRPDPKVYILARDLLKEAWGDCSNQTKAHARELKKEIDLIERKIEQLMERVIEVDPGAMTRAYEKQIRKLNAQQIEITEKMEKISLPRLDFDETFRTALTFLSNPYKLWESGEQSTQNLVIKLAFADNLTYHRNQGFQTPKTALPFRMLGAMKLNFCEEVSPDGFEPSTY